MTGPVGWGEGGKGTIIIIDCIIKKFCNFCLNNLMLHIIAYSLRASLLACKEILKIGLSLTIYLFG